MVKNIIDRLFDPVDAASLVVYRIVFGLILADKVYDFFAHGWIRSYYIRPRMHFKYYGFDWVQAWPGNGMYWHFGVIGVSALCIALGLFYRVATVVFFLSFSFMFLLDQARYLNHYYLVVIFAFLLMFMPLNRSTSVDALIWKKKASETVAAWNLYLMRALLTIVYFYAAVAKMNGDWLRGEPMRHVAGRSRNDYELPLGSNHPGGGMGLRRAVLAVPVLYAYGGLLLDLLAWPLP